jgi:ring-1,2-phenylacetyl-CoA epoxidase subunit PaaC
MGLKEATYHLRHSKEWMLRLGDGTKESHRRLQTSVDDLWPFTKELFVFDETERALIDQGIIPPLSGLEKNGMNSFSGFSMRQRLPSRQRSAI